MRPPLSLLFFRQISPSSCRLPSCIICSRPLIIFVAFPWTHVSVSLAGKPSIQDNVPNVSHQCWVEQKFHLPWFAWQCCISCSPEGCLLSFPWEHTARRWSLWCPPGPSGSSFPGSCLPDCTSVVIYSSLGAGLGTFFFWTWGYSHRPNPPACWGPFERQEHPDEVLCFMINLK